MRHKIKLNEKEVEYTLKTSKRAKRMRLAVYCDGDFVVTAPRNVGLSAIERFIVEKSKWILDKLQYFRDSAPRTVARDNKKDYIENKERALALASGQVEFFNRFYGFKFNRIGIKNQKTRWGSCSKKGNLNFNYKIVLIPERLADYVIVHELCHLKEFNHSRKFWDLVAKIFPNYAKIRRELRNFKI